MALKQFFREVLTMKRILSFLLALTLLAALAGCGKREETPEPSGEQTLPTEDGITLAELNVEFVAGERDTDALLELKKELPPLLIGALADEGVTVGKVNVTFGASDEATADALARGTVQVGFLPTETYLEHEDALRAAAVSLSPVIAVLGASASAYGQELSSKASGGFHANVSWNDLEKAAWALPQDDDGYPLRWLNAYLSEYYDGKSIDDLPHIIRYAAEETPDAQSCDLFVATTIDPITESGGTGGWQEAAYFFSTVTAVSAADDILCNEAFLTALGSAVESISADEDGTLHAYDGVRFGHVEQATLEATFEGWRLVYDHEHE